MWPFVIVRSGLWISGNVPTIGCAEVLVCWGVLLITTNWGLLLLSVDSKKLERGCSMIYAVIHSVFGLGLEDGHVLASTAHASWCGS